MNNSKEKYSEEEVRLRVAFKLGEILTAIVNMKNVAYQEVLHGRGPAQVTNARYELLKDIIDRIHKELNLRVPSESMEKEQFFMRRDQAVDAILSMIAPLGDPRRRARINTVVKIVEGLLNA